MSSRYTAYKDDIVQFELEDTVMGWVLHCIVSQWGAKKAEHINKAFHKVLQQLDRKEVPYLLAVIPESDPKNKRFAAMFGFKHFGYFPIKTTRGLEEVWVMKTRGK